MVAPDEVGLCISEAHALYCR